MLDCGVSFLVCFFGGRAHYLSSARISCDDVLRHAGVGDDLYGQVWEQWSDQSLGIEYRSKAACERVIASPSPAKGAVLFCMD